MPLSEAQIIDGDPGARPIPLKDASPEPPAAASPEPATTAPTHALAAARVDLVKRIGEGDPRAPVGAGR